jgi:eukaryotic-like serine/threonine-protein kinase
MAEIGQVFLNRYRIDGPLGKGGMATVYHTTDLTTGRRLAMKESAELTKPGTEHVRSEAAVLVGLHHPNLPQVLDIFEAGNRLFLVMDFVEGEDLAAILARRGTLSEHEALPIFRQVAAALAYLHNMIPPVIHGDVKPANIRVTPAGQAVLVDFGIAQILSGTVLPGGQGTAHYAPYEQYELTVRLDARSDIYSLGATMFTTLAGQLPAESVLRANGRASLTPPRRLNGNISTAMERVVLRAIEILPTDRYQTMEEMQAALNSIG